jgi:hypothetical protein
VVILAFWTLARDWKFPGEMGGNRLETGGWREEKADREGACRAGINDPPRGKQKAVVGSEMRLPRNRKLE